MTAVPQWQTVGGAGDGDLVRAFAGGDQRAFADIYDRYANRLYDFCVGMLADRDGAADCVQDTFCIAATRLSQLRDPDSVRSWLYSIARNEALRRIRARRREAPSDDLPDAESGDPGPDTLAARTELADLIADAAGGLSDRDRSVLELAFRHGLDGPDLAEALGVTPANANTIVHRLRGTIERSLGALLVVRRVNAGGGCPELSQILDGWDGHFNVLMRKRISRHIESCSICDDERRRLVSPVALLGAAPVFVPAPAWLRERTLSQVQLTSSTHDVAATRRRTRRSSAVPVAAFVAGLLAALAMTVVWLDMRAEPTSPQLNQTTSPPVAPASPPPPPPVAPIYPPPSARWTPPPEQPATQTPSVAPPVISEPTQTPSAPPPPPPPLPTPPWPQWPQLPPWPQWPDTDPGGSDPIPGGQFTGPSDIGAVQPPDTSVP